MAVGDAVAVDDPLVEISTDKVDADLPSPVAGTVAEILVEPDSTVAVGTVLCRIAAGAGAPATAPAARRAGPGPRSRRQRRGQRHPGGGCGSRARTASTSTRSQGSGPRGRVTKEDVLAALEGDAPPPAAEVKPIRGPAATLVRFMDESRSIPTATSFRTLRWTCSTPAAASSRTPAASSASPT